MAHLEVSVLGGLEVSIDDSPIQSFESDKVRALLAYLTVEADRAHRREKLIGLLWPDSPEEAARHNLRQALFNLRLVLGDHTAEPPYLLITRESIQFNRESDYSLDLDQFNGFFHAWETNQSQESADASSLIPQVEEMVKLYRGDYLQHFSLSDSTEFEDWILVQRESLRQHMMAGLTYLANEYEQRGNFQAAQCYALHQLKLDPWREEAHYQIMRVLALDGQRSAALAQYENCRKILAAELGVEPSAKMRDLYEQIRSGTLKTRGQTPADIPSVPVHNLPVPLTPFIGREQELADLDRLITDPGCRCISLVGPGGMGKTRLALQAADRQRNAFADGAAFIPLASVGSIDAVIPAIANAIQFAFYGPIDPRVQLLNYLRDKQMLLIVDNAEHLLVEDPHRGTIADLLIELLQGADQIKLLVTSRERLNLQGEWPFEVEGLDFPKVDQAGGLNEYGAVALFFQRAKRAYPGFQMNVEDKTVVARLCRLVEGMPLAIELAATWVRLLSPAEIATEIENSLDFLSAQMRDLPERHRSMRVVFDHSWQMLSTEEKQVLGRLSVFRGGFQRQAAEQVASASLSVLSSLLMRSLLRRTVAGRYDLHELIRQYAASKLSEDHHERYAVQERHSLYYMRLLEQNDSRLRSQYQKEAVAELTGELDNIHTAWDWSITNQKFISLYRVFMPLWYLYEIRNWFKEGESIWGNAAEELRAYIQEAKPEKVEYSITLNVMLADWAYFKFRQGKSLEAYTILTQSVDFLRTCPDPSAAIEPLLYFGIVCWQLGRFAQAKENLQDCLELSQKYGDRWFKASANEYLGAINYDQGKYHQARQYLNEALAIYRQIGDPIITAHTISYLGQALQGLREYSEAEQLLREGLELTREIGYRFGSAMTLNGLGQVAYAQEYYQEAQALFSQSADLFREIGDTHRLSRTLNHQGLNFLALSQTVNAQNVFTSALRMAYAGGYVAPTLTALTGLAGLEASQKPSSGILELLIYVLQHQSSTQETKDLAGQLRVDLETKLPKAEIEAAQQRARSKKLDEVVRQVLADLLDSSKAT